MGQGSGWSRKPSLRQAHLHSVRNGCLGDVWGHIQQREEQVQRPRSGSKPGGLKNPTQRQCSEVRRSYWETPLLWTAGQGRGTSHWCPLIRGSISAYWVSDSAPAPAPGGRKCRFSLNFCAIKSVPLNLFSGLCPPKLIWKSLSQSSL